MWGGSQGTTNVFERAPTATVSFAQMFPLPKPQVGIEVVPSPSANVLTWRADACEGSATLHVGRSADYQVMFSLTLSVSSQAVVGISGTKACIAAGPQGGAAWLVCFADRHALADLLACMGAVGIATARLEDHSEVLQTQPHPPSELDMSDGEVDRLVASCMQDPSWGTFLARVRTAYRRRAEGPPAAQQ